LKQQQLFGATMCGIAARSWLLVLLSHHHQIVLLSLQFMGRSIQITAQLLLLMQHTLLWCHDDGAFLQAAVAAGATAVLLAPVLY
jgi:hypothetical protein